MRLSYQPATQRDVNEILAHHLREGGDALADRFFADLMTRLDEVADHPERFPFHLGHRRFRRARLRQFPHLVVFRILGDRIRVTVIKHERRNPEYGMGRR